MVLVCVLDQFPLSIYSDYTRRRRRIGGAVAVSSVKTESGAAGGHPSVQLQ